MLIDLVRPPGRAWKSIMAAVVLHISDIRLFSWRFDIKPQIPTVFD